MCRCKHARTQWNIKQVSSNDFRGKKPAIQKEVISHSDQYLASLSSKTYVFEDKTLTKYYLVLLRLLS